jgi:hypothetical protein
VKLTAVLPVRAHPQRFPCDIDWLAKVVVPSFQRFWPRALALEFLIVTPPTDMRHMRDALRKPMVFPHRLLSDDELCPALTGKTGWHKQQILKLAAAEWVTTEHYLTLDADVVLIRELTPKDLFPDGKPTFQAEPAGAHRQWWLGSQSILKQERPIEDKEMVMGVTPEILRTELCRALRRAIAERNRAGEVDAFLYEMRAMNWTEYSLYWSYIRELGLAKQHYSSTGRSLYRGLWREEQVESLRNRQVNDVSKGELPAGNQPPFMVLHSKLGLSLPERHQLIAMARRGILRLP